MEDDGHFLKAIFVTFILLPVNTSFSFYLPPLERLHKTDFMLAADEIHLNYIKS